MKLLIPAIALLSSTVMAADLKFNVEGRFDYANSTVKHEFATATNNFEEKRSEFDSNVLRLNMVATINENLSARFRYRFSTAQDAASKNRDLSFQNVDFFFIDHKTSMFTTRIGKQSQVESLGREFFISATDYPTTAYNSTSGATGYIASNTAVYNTVKSDADLYRVGVSLIFKQLEDQTFTISAFNPAKSTTYTDTAGASNDAKNSKMGLGAYYNGSFLNKMIQPTLGYTTFGIAPETDLAGAPNTVSASNKLMAAGIRSEVAGFVIDADWKQYKRDNTSTATSTADKTTSIWANVAYTWDNLTPFVNYINDKYTKSANNLTDYKRNAISAGLQFKPFKDNNFRYQVAYTSDVKKIDAATGTNENKVTAHQISAGIKFDI
ncbi:MAG: hypothetical protein H7281_02780 [Bacteriovorax sp.]|nr:hypothetical protein [Bacteriovorax sp.]